MLQHFMFISFYGNTALNEFGVINVHPASSGPDILHLLLKALINISAPFSPTRNKLSIQFFHRFFFDYFMSINWPKPSSILKIASCA